MAKTDIDYDEFGNVTRCKGLDGIEETYEYDSENRIIKFTRRDMTYTVTYNNELQHKVTDNNGVFVIIDLNMHGDIVHAVTSDGVHSYLDYDDKYNLIGFRCNEFEETIDIQKLQTTLTDSEGFNTKIETNKDISRIRYTNSSNWEGIVSDPEKDDN